MIHEVLAVGPLQCNCSVFGDEASRKAVVIDPGDDLADIQAILHKHGLAVEAIVITHAHIDHIGGAAKLKQITGAPVYMNQNDQVLYDGLEWQAGWLGMPVPERTSIDVAVRDGDSVRAAGLDLQVLHTPGHTQGSISLWLPDHQTVVAGDTLFRDSIGRTDLPGGNYRQILSSIHEKLLALPDETLVVCGHGPHTTIGREKERNPFLA